MEPEPNPTASELLAQFREFVEREVARNGGPQPAVKPPNRIHFEWPKPPVSAKYHIPHSAWTGSAVMDVDGAKYPVLVADTEYGVFGRCEHFWAEARAATRDGMLARLRNECEPLWDRQRAIGAALGIDGRVETPLPKLSAIDHLRLLYGSDRDVANETAGIIDRRARRGYWGPALLEIMKDRGLPLRRQAQWCVLDLFEDLPSYFPPDTERLEALMVLERFLWDCEDDFARTCYKCGDVLGDHIADERALQILVRVLKSAPSPIGRRSSIHGLIHIAEWLPDRRDEILSALRWSASEDSHPQLRGYADVAINDIEVGAPSFHPHGPEPVFEGE